MHEIEQYKERLHIALRAAKICIFEVDLPRQLYTFFENAEAIFGVSGERILQDVQPYSALEPEEYRLAVSRYFSHPDDEETIKAAFEEVLSGRPATYEARMKAGESQYVWCRIDVTPILENGVPVRMVGVITDIADLKEKAETLQHATHLDAFTGLYNKEYTIRLIREALAQSHGQTHALVILDIDHFKRFNDTYGHDRGDVILKVLCKTIQKAFRKTDVVGRFGGDEFIVFVKDIPDPQWLRQKFQGLTSFDAGDCHCTCSVGIAVFPQDGSDYDTLFKKADRALYQAKASKEELVFYSEIG